MFEFTHFVHDKHMTLSNSIFGSTFYTLTGTHGTHVAIGVLLLGMMYVRTFKPADGRSGLGLNLAHLLVVAAATGLSFILIVPGFLEFIEEGISLAHFQTYLGHNAAALGGLAACLAVMSWFNRAAGPVDFGEKNAIDVESIGLYWHFVDIVWIIIFTAVYLIEYL